MSIKIAQRVADRAQELASDGLLDRKDISALADIVLEDKQIDADDRQALLQLYNNDAYVGKYTEGAGALLFRWSHGGISDGVLAARAREFEKNDGHIDAAEANQLLQSANEDGKWSQAEVVTVRSFLLGGAMLLPEAEEVLAAQPALVRPYERAELAFRPSDPIPTLQPASETPDPNATFQEVKEVIDDGWTQRRFQRDDGSHFEITRKFRDDGQLKRLQIDQKADGSVTEVQDYLYDNKGLLQGITITPGNDPAAATSAREIRYDYDSQGRLSAESQAHVSFPDDPARREVKQTETATHHYNTSTKEHTIELAGEGRRFHPPTDLPNGVEFRFPKGEITAESHTLTAENSPRAVQVHSRATNLEEINELPDVVHNAVPEMSKLAQAKVRTQSGSLLAEAEEKAKDGTLDAADLKGLLAHAWKNGILSKAERAQLETIVATHRPKITDFATANQLLASTQLRSSPLAKQAHKLAQGGPLQEADIKALLESAQASGESAGIDEGERSTLRAIFQQAFPITDRARAALQASNRVVAPGERSDLAFKIPHHEEGKDAKISYRQDGQIERIDLRNPQGEIEQVQEYVYNDAGQLLSVSQKPLKKPGGEESADEKAQGWAITYTYDDQGKLSTESLQKDEKSSVATHKWQDGKHSAALKYKDKVGSEGQITFDAAGRAVHYMHNTQSNATAKREEHFTYDQFDRLIRAEETLFFTDSPEYVERETSTYSYDPQGGGLTELGRLEERSRVGTNGEKEFFRIYQLQEHIEAKSGLLQTRDVQGWGATPVLTQLKRKTHAGDRQDPEKLHMHYRQQETFQYADDQKVTHVDQVTSETYTPHA